MKNIKEKSFILIILLVACIIGIPTFIQAADITIQKRLEYGTSNTVGASVTSGDYEYYNLQDGTIMLEKYNGTEKNLNVPSKIDGKKVTIINTRAFKDNSSIVTVTFPDTVLYIDSYVFSNCANLTTVNVPNSVLKMYTLVNGCPKLNKFEVPSTLTERDNVYVNVSTVTVEGNNNYDLAKQVVDLVNEERANLGLTELKFDLELCNAAMERAAETSVYWEHTRPDSTSCFTISSKINGENIGAGNVSAALMVENWMNSPGHKRQIINSNYKTIGVGVFKTNGATYWVQEFSQNDIEAEVTKTGKEDVTRKIQVANGWGLFNLRLSGIKDENTIKVGETLAPTSVRLINKADTLTFYTPIANNDITWKSSDTNVFTVDSQGNVLGKGAGTATLTASIGTYSQEYSITVEAGLKGDINGDGTINMLDINYGYIKLQNGDITAEEEQRGDVTGEGTYNLLDINKIYLYLEGRISNL